MYAVDTKRITKKKLMIIYQKEKENAIKNILRNEKLINIISSN